MKLSKLAILGMLAFLMTVPAAFAAVADPIPVSPSNLYIPFLVIPFICLWYIFRGLGNDNNPLWGNILASGLGLVCCGVVALWFLQGGITATPVIIENISYAASVFDANGSVVGPPGPPGPAGEAATIDVNYTFTGDAGTSALVTNIGTNTAASLDFTIPRGETGLQGIQGIPGVDGTDGTDGAAATIDVNNTVTLPAGNPATVSNIGTTSAALLDFGIPTGSTGAKGDPGDPGATGDPGVNGTAATITVNNTVTLSPGSPATVTNIGTDTAANLDFGIPSGADGAPGTTGDPGAPGADGRSASVTINSTTTGSPASVTNIGNTTDVVLDFVVQQGIQGIPGFNGTDGAAATIEVNSTFTGAPGTSAIVSNVGSTSAALFDFTIPEGAKGDTGDIPDVAQFLFLNGTRQMTGNLSAGSYNINNVATPSVDTDAANKAYVDSRPVYNASYVETTNTSYLLVDGSRAMTGNLSMGSQYITGLHDPSISTDAATKGYVDTVNATRIDYNLDELMQTHDAVALPTTNLDSIFASGVYNMGSAAISNGPAGYTPSIYDLLIVTGEGATPSGGYGIKYAQVIYDANGTTYSRHYSGGIVPPWQGSWDVEASHPDTSQFLLLDGSRKMTGTFDVGGNSVNDVFNILWNGTASPGYSQIRNSASNTSAIITSGGTSIYGGAAVVVYGGEHSTYPSRVDLRVPNTAKTASLPSLIIDGNTDIPVITFPYGKLYQSVTNGYMQISGGNNAAGSGAVINLHGSAYWSAPGSIKFYIPNATQTGLINVLNLAGNTDTPTIDALTHRILNVGTPTTNGDALPYNAWTTWSPTLVWVNGTPTSLLGSSYRYSKVGKTIYYDVYVDYADSNWGYLSTITLPETPSVISVTTGGQYVGTVWHLTGFFAHTDGKLTTLVQDYKPLDGQRIGYRISGFYEVA